MTFQISQRGKEYLETARTLLRAAQTMTDRAIAGQLRALADDYQRRAEKASHVCGQSSQGWAYAAPRPPVDDDDTPGYDDPSKFGGDTALPAAP
jgi:hypothetical protein